MKPSLFPLPQSTYENNHQKRVPPFLIHIVITAHSCQVVNTSVQLLEFEIFKGNEGGGGGGSVQASLMPKSGANTFSHWYSTVLCRYCLNIGF